MSSKKFNQLDSSACPVSFALEIFGDRWTLIVLKDVVLESRYRYKDLLAANPGIATNILADRLKRLEQRGFVSKQRDAHDARQYLYKPTRLAISTIPMLVEMIIWGSENGVGRGSKQFTQRFKSDREGLIRELQQSAIASAGYD